ncbi:MAG TPA: sigma-70 region 4 domain-containing protein [Nitrososphaeraceae archaeon]|jgi:DNA-binding transcriptional regulator LsrR (DeoR family)|nr:sigma-70 region 4 domain-containing protein [Nitrososphaeraceae archaeon]
MGINKHQLEVQLQQIFRMMLENKTQEEIAHELNINVRTVQRYYQRIDKRYGDFQREKTNDTLFLECTLFKNRMLTLYKGLENSVLSDKTSGTEKARCAEVAADIATNILKMESEGLKIVREMLSNGTYYNNTHKTGQTKNDEYSKEEYNPNRKF